MPSALRRRPVEPSTPRAAVDGDGQHESSPPPRRRAPRNEARRLLMSKDDDDAGRNTTAPRRRSTGSRKGRASRCVTALDASGDDDDASCTSHPHRRLLNEHQVQLQKQRPPWVAGMALEVWGHAYKYLTAVGQGRLRRTCRRLVAAFDEAVRNEVFIGSWIAVVHGHDDDALGCGWRWVPLHLQDATIIPDRFRLNDRHIKGIRLPDTITAIGEQMLAHSSVEVVTLPRSISRMGGHRFLEHCHSLRLLVLSDTQLVAVPHYFCNNCPALTTIVLPATVTSIGEDFARETAVESMVLPSSVVEIGSCFLQGCQSLRHVDLSDTRLVHVPVSFCNYCPALTTIVLPATVTSIPFLMNSVRIATA